MSGGSFNYLYDRCPEQPGQLVEMAEEARREGFVVGADALDEILTTLAHLREQWNDAAGFMRAFEWWRSGDWGPGRVAQAEHHLALHPPEYFEEKQD